MIAYQIEGRPGNMGFEPIAKGRGTEAHITAAYQSLRAVGGYREYRIVIFATVTRRTHFEYGWTNEPSGNGTQIKAPQRQMRGVWSAVCREQEHAMRINSGGVSWRERLWLKGQMVLTDLEQIDRGLADDGQVEVMVLANYLTGVTG